MNKKDSLHLEVIGYEDLMNDDGEYVTYYTIQVDVKWLSKIKQQVQTQPNVPIKPNKKLFSYKIRKRYTEFYNLYYIFKDQLPCSYKFPNKSYFSNSSNVTKDRRVRGFDELLNILYSAFNFPPELREFIRLDEHIAEYYNHLDGDSSSVINKKLTENQSVKSIVDSSTQIQSNSYETEAQEKLKGLNIKLIDKELEFSNYLVSNDINYSILKKIKLDFSILFRRSLLLSLLLYGLIFFLGIISFDHSNQKKISQFSYTILSFFIMFFLLQFRFIRKEIITEFRNKYKDQL